MNLLQINYLVRKDRTRALRRKVIGMLPFLAAGIVTAAVSTGPAMTAAGIAITGAAVLTGVLPVAMLVADRRAAKERSARPVAFAELIQKLADKRAAAVHARVLKQLADTGQEPRSLAIIVINTVNGLVGGTPSVYLSTINADGVLATEWIDDRTSQWILQNIASPFLTATDWRASVIAANPGQPATAQLLDAAGRGVVTEEWDKPDDEQFLRYHRSPAAAG